MLAPASGMLTSWTDGKSARKTYIQLILGKKLEKFVLTTQNCPVCMCQRDDISLARPGRAGLVGKAGCLRRLRVPLASLLPAGGPEAAAPHWWMGGVSACPVRVGDMQLHGYEGVYIPFFFFHLSAHAAASLCFGMVFCKHLSQRADVLCFPREDHLHFLWDDNQADKSQNLSSRQGLLLKGACGYDITVFSAGCILL